MKPTNQLYQNPAGTQSVAASRDTNTFALPTAHHPKTMSLRTALLALPLGLALVLAGCGGEAAENSEETDETTLNENVIPVHVLVADPALFEDVIEVTGTVDSPGDAMLGAESSGSITYLAPLGSFVRAGGTVAQIDPSLAQAQVSAARAGVAQAEAGLRAAQAQRQAAQANLELAEDQFRRQEPLYRDSILSALEFRGVQTQQASARAQVAQADAGIAQAQGAVQQARAALQQAQTGYANTRVSAPSSGTVESHLVSRGETVGPGTPVARFVSSEGVRIMAGIPERYAGEIEVGTPVDIMPTAGGTPIEGRVSFAGRAVDAMSRTFPVEVALNAGAARLQPDMVVRLSVSRAILQDVIAVPLNAIVRDERGTSVYVAVEKDGHLEALRRPVTLGPSSNGHTVILEGLEAGDQIVASGQSSIEEGDLLRILDSESTDAAAMLGSEAETE